ncbi:MAG: hypothetical protein KGR98_10755, partial [Verrucomicrobia bacterium]|nr:hypothetical protein [Verrucomicrobiota bacterium]
MRNFRTASILAFIFMPAGSTLDIAVYPAYFWEFFLFRWVCSAFLLFFWWFIKTPIGLRYYRVLGWIMPLLPTALIAYMIYATQGSNSPYYAGLNLVLLGAAIILRWTLLDSVIVFLEVLVLYLGACFLHGPIHSGGVFFNNIYFIFVTGVFVVFGSYFYNQLRFREFAFRYQLDKNKRELEATNRKLVEIDRLKSRFFANVSHEMRTPLTLLLSPMEALMDRLGHSLDARARESLTTMHSNAMRLLRLVNDLLDLVRLESGRMELKRDPIEVAGFVKGLASAVRQVAENKRVRLETFCDERLGVMLGDRDKLEKIAFNLLFNALKFTPEGGRVELRAERRNAPTLPAFRPPEGAARSTGEGKPAEEPGEEFVFIVSDTGIGIAEKDLPFVFDRFWQADSSSRRKHSGVGI